MYNQVMRVLVTGASGQLGPYVVRCLLADGQTVIAWGRSWTGELFGVPVQDVDLTDHDAIADAFGQAQPDAVVHAGAVSQVGQAYREPALARVINVDATQVLAQLAGERRCRMIYLSTDMVFDGEHAPYRERDPTGPRSVYGRTKLEGEESVVVSENVLVVRVSLLFGPTLIDRPRFFDELVATLRETRPVHLFVDEWRTVLGLAEAATAIVAALRSDDTGLLHVGGPQRVSRYDMGLNIAQVFGFDTSLVKEASRVDLNVPEPRPRDLSLDSTRWRAAFGDLDYPDFQTSLRQMLSGNQK